MKLPAGKGLFPAFWLISENFEIDVMEMIGNEPDIVYAVNHYLRKGYYKKEYGYKTGVDTSEFHVYALEWEEDELRWYIDDEMIYSTTKNVSDEPMFILFTLAVGGVWPGNPNDSTPFPASIVVDEISIYKRYNKEGGGRVIVLEILIFLSTIQPLFHIINSLISIRKRIKYSEREEKRMSILIPCL